jgi:hypothetical protein
MEMSPGSEERVSPVDPERFHLALGVYQAALAAAGAEANAGEASSTRVEKGGVAAAPPAEIPASRAIRAVKKEFPDSGEFQSMSLRLQRIAEIVGDKKLIKWGMVKYDEAGGFEIHDAVINALATAPFRKSGVLDKPAFHSLVKAEYTRLEAVEKG